MSYDNFDKLQIGVEVLNKLHKALEGTKNYSPPFIAGGLVRDTLTDTYSNDIDIYLSYNYKDMHLNDKVTNILNRLGLENSMIINQANNLSDNYRGSHTKLLYTYSNPHVPIEIIYSNHNIEGTLKRFDIGLCMVAYDHKYKLHMTESFKKDRDNKTMTIYPTYLNDFQISRAIKYHVYKLTTDKYKDYELKIDYNEPD